MSPPRTPTKLSRLMLAALLCAGPLAGCSPSDPVQEAEKLWAEGKPEQALDRLRTALEARPDDPELNFRYGVALSNTGQRTAAAWSFQKAMQDEDWRAPAATQLALNALRTGNQDSAIEHIDVVLEGAPENVGALLIRAQAKHDSRRDYEGGLADAQRALEIDPDSRDALIWVVVNLLALERVEEAAPLLDELDRRYAEADTTLEQQLYFCTARAAFAAAKQETELADERFRECLEQNPAHGELVGAAVEFYQKQGRGDRALEVLLAAHEAAPLGGYRATYARHLVQLGRADEAERVLLEGTENTDVTESVNSWMDLAAYYTGRKDYSAAATAVKSAIERLRKVGQPLPAQLLFNHADMLLLAGRPEEAVAAGREIANPAFRAYVEGRALLMQGKPAEALERLDESLLNWPNSAAGRYHAAVAAEQLGDIDRAIEEYRYSVRSGPDQTDARVRLGRLLSAAGDAEEALMALAAGGADVDSRIEGLRVMGRHRGPADWRRQLGWFRGKPRAAEALVALAEGLHARGGAEPAVRVLEGVDIDLTRAENAAVLRHLVAYLVEAGRADEALARADAAVQARPEAAASHEIRGRALAASGAPAAEVRAALEKALTLAPEDAHALEALAAQAASEGDAERALELYARAAEADPESARPVRGAAELLLSLDRRAEAEQRLEELIARSPYDPWAPVQLAKLRIERGAEAERTRRLVRQAVRFGGGEEAESLLERVDRPREAAAGA